MAVSADGFGISCAFWFGGMALVFLLFQYLRRLGWTENFYQRKHFFPPKQKGLHPPPYISKSSYWPKAVVNLTEKTMLSSSGTDALMYCASLRFAFEVFLMVTFFTSAVILPINITGDNVDALTKADGLYDNSTISDYIKWYLPGLNGTAANGTEGEAVSLFAFAFLIPMIDAYSLFDPWRFRRRPSRPPRSTISQLDLLHLV